MQAGWVCISSAVLCAAVVCDAPVGLASPLVDLVCNAQADLCMCLAITHKHGTIPQAVCEWLIASIQAW